MLRALTLFICGFPLVAFSQSTTTDNVIQGTEVKDPSKFPKKTLVLDRVYYADRVYSSSRKTELGDRAELEMSVRYQQDDNSFSRFRFETDPTTNRKDNETSKFEIIYNRKFEKLTFQIDLDLKTNDDDTGGTVLALDTDSDDMYLSYNSDHNFDFTFYPFNFRSDVGKEFNTRDVTRVSYIDGSPTTILATPANDEEIVSKTIPGIEFKYNMSKSYVYAGLGVASYLYPVNSDFDIQDNPTATAWERKEALAYKLGYLYNADNDMKINLQYVEHTKTEETGALLAQGLSASYFKALGKFMLAAEVTSTRAGDAPYNVSRKSNWFEDVTLNKPVYSDLNGDAQDWIGKTDQGYHLKLGYRLDSMLPYISLKHHGEYFIYNEKYESANSLRTDDESKSHGGLNRIALGSYFYHNNLFFNPEIEYQQAKNAVFSNSTDVAADRLQSSFTKNNTLLTIYAIYSFDGSSLVPNWWF